MHSSVHRHGLRFFRVLAAAVARGRADGSKGLSRHVADAGTVHHHLRLESRQHGVDVHAVLCAARRLGRDLGRLAGARRPAQGRLRRGAVLGRRPAAWRPRRLPPSALAALARRRRHRRHRSRPWLYFPGVDADQMVPRPPRHGDRHGHHGFRRRRHDRRAAGEHPDQLFQDPDRCRRLADLRRVGRDLFRLHDDRRLRLSGIAGRLAARRLDTAEREKVDDHGASRPSQGCAQDAAILADLVGADPERFCRHRRDRHGFADVAGDLRRQADRHARSELQRAFG